MIDACLEMFDLRRAHEWTSALTTFWERQPDLTTFTGQCLIHRAEILQLHGAWPDALEVARRARQRLAHSADTHATGAAFYREAELYRVRGELLAAGEAYREATAWGHPGQPGLALLWLAEGKLVAAEHAIRRVVAETVGRLGRASCSPLRSRSCSPPARSERHGRPLSSSSRSPMRTRLRHFGHGLTSRWAPFCWQRVMAGTRSPSFGSRGLPGGSSTPGTKQPGCA